MKYFIGFIMGMIFCALIYEITTIPKVEKESYLNDINDHLECEAFFDSTNGYIHFVFKLDSIVFDTLYIDSTE